MNPHRLGNWTAEIGAELLTFENMKNPSSVVRNYPKG